MSRNPASKSVRKKGTLDSVWNANVTKETSPKKTDTQEKQKAAHDDEMLSKEELLSTLKDFQEDLKKSLKDEIMGLRDDFQQQLDTMGAAVQLVHERTETCEVGVKNSEAEVQKLQKEIAESKRQSEFLFSKCEDLENRERRRNLRLRGVPEKTEDADMNGWAVDFLTKFQPDLTKEDVAMERAHRVGPLLAGTDRRPRDILLRFNNFQSKEKILQKARNTQRVMCGEDDIQIFQDIAQSTLQRRASLKIITTALRDKAIRYKWLFPFGLGFMWNNRYRNITTLEEGRKFLPEDMFTDTAEQQEEGAARAESTPWPWTLVNSRKQKTRRKEKQTTVEEEEGGGDES